MTWRYHQNNGLFEHDGKLVSDAYAGKGHWKNPSRDEAIHGKGPLPQSRTTLLPPLPPPKKSVSIPCG